jgi:hypothetical protein
MVSEWPGRLVRGYLPPHDMSLLDIRKKRGDSWTADAWNRHLEEIDRYLSTLGVSNSGRGRRGAVPGPIYLARRADAGASPGDWLVRVGQGYVGGVIPQIGDKRITDVDPDTGDTPALTVKPSAFSGKPKNSGDWLEGIAFIYARVSFNNPSWDLLKVEMAPALSMSSRTPLTLCALRLSMTTTAPGQSWGTSTSFK